MQTPPPSPAQPQDQSVTYARMWEDFGTKKAGGLLEQKFVPTTRIGLTNYLREVWIFRKLPIRSTDVVADIGCASGRQVFLAAKQAKHAIGTDIAHSFIEAAEAHKVATGTTNVDFRVCPIEQLALTDQEVDSVICSEVLEHVLDLPPALKELKRIIKPGGYLLVTVPNQNADGTLLGRFLRLIGVRSFTPITDFTEDGIVKHGDAHVREFTPATLASTLSQAGFAPLSWTTVSMIDFHDRAFNLMLRVSLVRRVAIWIENGLSRLRLPLGRHIVMLTKKAND